MESVLELLDEMEDVLESGKAVPFSNKVTINRDDIAEIVREIRTNLPNEIKQSKWVIEERNKILIEAQKEADDMLKAAEERTMRMVDEAEVTKKAYDQASSIVESAKKTAKEMRLGAVEYAEDVLSDAESKLLQLKTAIFEESMKNDEYFANTLNILADNIRELGSSR